MKTKLVTGNKYDFEATTGKYFGLGYTLKSAITDKRVCVDSMNQVWETIYTALLVKDEKDEKDEKDV